MAEGSGAPPFEAIHRHGFVRVAAASPTGSSGDVAFNVDQAIALAEEADGEGLRPRRLSRAQHLLLRGRRSVPAGGLPRRGRGRHRPLPRRRPRSSARCSWSERRCGATAGSTIAPWSSPRGRILGVVPKSFLPNYREYYEKRWFVSGIGLNGIDIAVAGEIVPFGTDLIFAAEDLDDFIFHVEICEDYWAPQPPSTRRARSPGR